MAAKRSSAKKPAAKKPAKKTAAKKTAAKKTSAKKTAARKAAPRAKATPSLATFQVYQDAAGGWRWRLAHTNGNILADSGESYASREKANEGISSVKANAAGARTTG